MKKSLKLGLLFIILMSLNSCAIMFNGVKQEVTVKSMTPDAKIYIDGDFAGKDIVSVKLKRKNNHTVFVKKEQCKTEKIEIESNIQAGWIVFDALLNWFAFLTDAPTGAWKSFDKTNITVDLECEKQTNPKNNDHLILNENSKSLSK